MTASVKRTLSALFVVVLLGAVASTFSMSTAFAGPRPVMAGSAPGGHHPKGAVGVLGENYRFCVKHFKPNSTVTVKNQLTGRVVYIHTDANGAGCVTVPVKRACDAVTQTITATGTGADGKPATITQTVTVPATSSLCAGGATRDPSNSGGTLPFTGSDFIIPGVIIGVVLIAVGTAMTVVRRRRAAGTPA